MDYKAKNFPLWTALITPFNDSKEVDYKAFTQLLKRQEKAQNGILILGSTGEGLALNLEEKKQIVQTAAKLNLGVPLMIGVGGFNLEECKDWILFCQDLNINAFLLVTPLYAKPGPKGQVEWFKHLLDTSKLPCMLYNVPSRSGVEMHLDVLKELADHQNFWALKEASGCVEKFKAFAQYKDKIELFSGDDPLTHAFCQEGGVGLVSVMSNIWPESSLKYVHYCLNNQPEKIYPLWTSIADSLFEASNPIPTKMLLKELQIIPSATLREPLTTNELPILKKQLQANKDVINWTKEN